ncbi:MAG: hypothetical protein AAGK92_16635 [Pseudomonadota bacterium]
MSDRFKSFGNTLQSPPSGGAPISPDDVQGLAMATRALNVAISGDVTVTTVDGDTFTLHIAAGSAFPIRVIKVFATGTTATGIVGLW